MNKAVSILRGPVGPLMMESHRIADDVVIITNALIEAKKLLDCGKAGDANKVITVALMAVSGR